MSKKQWMYLILIFIIVIPVLFFYNAFNGNPVSKLLSKTALKNYLEETYHDKEFRFDDGFYNFKIGGYTYNVVLIGSEKEYDFDVAGFIKPSVSYDGIYYANLDEPLIEKLGKEASEEIEKLIIKDVPNLLNVDVQVEVLKGTYDAETKWDKDIKLEIPMYIHITTDAANQTKEDVLATMKQIQQTLNKDGYTYDSVTINSNVQDKEFTEKDQFGYVKFSGSFTKNDAIKLKDIEQLN